MSKKDEVLIEIFKICEEPTVALSSLNLGVKDLCKEGERKNIGKWRRMELKKSSPILPFLHLSFLTHKNKFDKALHYTLYTITNENTCCYSHI